MIMPTVQIPDHAIAFEHNGIAQRPGDPAIVLVHGAGGQARDWPLAWRTLKGFAPVMGQKPKDLVGDFNRRPVYALDLPGHGRSPGPGLDSVSAYADVVAAVLDKLALDRAIVIGHSMGAAIALELGARRNPRLAGLVLVGGAARLQVTDAILDGLRDAFPETVDVIVKYSWARESSPFFKSLGRERMLACGKETVLGDFLACARYDLRERLGDVEVPALVLASANDRMVPIAASTAMDEGIPRSEMVTLEDAGHFLHVERPAPCAAAIAEFCRKIENG